MTRNGVLAGIAALALLATPLLGCGGGDDEVAALEDAIGRLEQAREAVDEASHDVEEASAALAERQEAANEARAALAEAREGLAQAEKQLASAQSSVSERATDDVLFRTIQKRLLDDEELADVAISAKVTRGVVVLSGQVPDADLRERALEIANAVQGSVAVESRIAVVGGEPPPVAEGPAE